MDNKQLTVADMQDVSEAIIRIVAAYPDLPFEVDANNVQWQALTASQGIGLATTGDSIYLKQYISGNRKCQMTFNVRYRCSPTNNASRLSGQKELENIADWMEINTASFEDNKYSDLSLERITNVSKVAAYEDGTEDYMCTMKATYFLNKRR